MVDSPKTREDLAAYYHEVSRWDHFIGRVVGALEETGALENSLILVLADNGRPFPRDKGHLYDGGIRTPLVAHFPAGAEGAVSTSSLVSSIDIAPTILDLAGVEIPDCIQGVSFLPILSDPQVATRTVAFAERNWHVYRAHERMVRFGDFLYIRNNTRDQKTLVGESHLVPSGEELWRAHARGETSPAQQQLFADPVPEEQLYRISSDPHQLENLAGQPALAEALAEARSLLDRWSEETLSLIHI